MPRVSQAEVEARRERLAEILAGARYLPVGELARRLDVSEVTARRDLAALDRQDRIRRTHGGAVASDVAADAYDRRFASFDARRRVSAPAKAAIARAAVDLVTPGQSVFIDAGTPCFRAAAELRRRGVPGVTVLTQSLAVADLLGEAFEVTLTGGRLLPRQQTLVGDVALANVAAMHVDLALLAAEAFGVEGLANSQADVVLLQRAVMKRAAGSVWLMHAGKLGRAAAEPVAAWDEVRTLLTDAADLADLPVAARRRITTVDVLD